MRRTVWPPPDQYCLSPYGVDYGSHLYLFIWPRQNKRSVTICCLASFANIIVLSRNLHSSVKSVLLFKESLPLGSSARDALQNADSDSRPRLQHPLDCSGYPLHRLMRKVIHNIRDSLRDSISEIVVLATSLSPAK